MERDSLRGRWHLLTVPAVIAFLGLLALARPETVYDNFIWRYFWGPVVADAMNQATTTLNGVVAYRGYNAVNEVGYGILLVYAVLLLVAVFRRFDIGEEKGFVLPFVPFVIAGGLLRVVEDAGMVSLPWRYLTISPVIYFTVFAAVLLTLLLSVWLEREGAIGSYRSGVAMGGTLLALVTGSSLILTADIVNAWMLPASLGLATLVFAPSYLTFRYVGAKELLGWEKGTVLFSHLLDAGATALSISLLGYGEKHPLVDFIMSASGTPYAFIPVKLAVISGILYYMDEDVRRDGPLLHNLVLLGILAVGLGPGTRNAVRAVLGV